MLAAQQVIAYAHKLPAAARILTFWGGICCHGFPTRMGVGIGRPLRTGEAHRFIPIVLAAAVGEWKGHA